MAYDGPVVPVADGGTGATTLTNNGILIGHGTSPVTASVLANGQMLIGSTGNSPSVATITAGTGISISSGAGSLTINGVGGGVTWSVITINQTAAVNNGYICNKAGTLALALPAASAVGDIIEVTGVNTALGWQITQAAGQQVFFGLSSTTLGATGTITSSAVRDALRMVCITANTTWQVLSAVGSLTIA